MPTLKFTIKGVEFEFKGEQDEITAFISRFMYEGASLHESQSKPKTPKDTSASLSPNIEVHHAESVSKGRMIEPLKITDLPLPDYAAVLDYIMQKPSYEHTLPEIQRKFYGRIYQSRGNEQRMWHRTSRQLKIVRKIIEQRFGGKFKEESAGERNLKRYVFVSNQAVLMEGEPRTS